MKFNIKNLFPFLFLITTPLYAIGKVKSDNHLIKIHFDDAYTYKNGRSINLFGYGINLKLGPKTYLFWKKSNVNAKGRSANSFFKVDTQFYGIKTDIKNSIRGFGSVRYELAQVGKSYGQSGNSSVKTNSFDVHTIALKSKSYSCYGGLSIGSHHKFYGLGIGLNQSKRYQNLKLDLGGKAILEYRDHCQKKNLGLKPYLYAMAKINLNKNFQINVGAHVMPLGIPYTGTPLKGLSMALIRQDHTLVQRSKKEFNAYLNATCCIKI